MFLRRCIIILFLCASFAFAQDTIRGTYTYTYGDKESLVEARQTCKDLAVREAIESYYIFVESSTQVENFQVKEDILQSIAASYLKDLRIVEQNEEGRTITTTVEATVMPEEVKKLVEDLAVSKEKETVTEKETITEKEDSTDIENQKVTKASSFIGDLWKYEKKMKATESMWAQRKFSSALQQMGEIQQNINHCNPGKENAFSWLMYQAIKTRTDLVENIIRAEYLESQGKKIRARANRKMALKNAENLQNYLANLEKLNDLTYRQNTIRKVCMSRCRYIMGRVLKKKQVRRR